MNQKFIYVIQTKKGFVCDKEPYVCDDVNDATHYRSGLDAKNEISRSEKHMQDAHQWYSSDAERNRAIACVGGTVKKYIRTVMYCEVTLTENYTSDLMNG